LHMMMKNKNIENLVYISQIDTRDIFVYAEDALELLVWLNGNGHTILSWEAFIETKNEIIRTLNFGNKIDSPYRNMGEEISKIKNDIAVAIDDWKKDQQNSHLIICINLKDELKPRINYLSKSTRIISGIFGLCCIGILRIFFTSIIINSSFEELELVPILSTLICGPIFLYAAFTGKGDLNFINPENYFKKLRKKKIKTESGQLRWPANA
jgi:hypothetical protein